METIFVKVLKKLITEQLSPVDADQKSKSTGYGHNNALSLFQQTKVNELMQKISSYSTEHGDDVAVFELIELVTQQRIEIQGVRESHNKDKDDGVTITCLTGLERHIKELYDKIVARTKTSQAPKPYKLLDVEVKRNPLHLIYELDIYYLGAEIFEPNKHIDKETRKAKEERLTKRVQALTERVLVEYSNDLDGLKIVVMEALNDLERDNEDIIKNEKGIVSTIFSSLSFYGWKAEVSTAGEGRLGRFIASTRILIETMLPKNFQPLTAQAEASSSTAKQPSPMSSPALMGAKLKGASISNLPTKAADDEEEEDTLVKKVSRSVDDKSIVATKIPKPQNPQPEDSDDDEEGHEQKSKLSLSASI